jgi:hypothetical protein
MRKDRASTAFSRPLPVQSMDHIFISYRRNDSGEFIPQLVKRLSKVFAVDKIFHDKVSIAVGDNFVERIDNAIAQCGAFISVIGPQWLAEKGETGPNRLFDGNDFVRIEIQSAIERGLSIVPVLLNGATMPRDEMLPDKLQPLTKINAVELCQTDPDRNFEPLVEAIELGLEYARFQAHDRIIKDAWARKFSQDFRDGKLKMRGNMFLCQFCKEYFEPDKNTMSSCSYHPDFPTSIGSAGPAYDYAEVWEFPCCGQIVKGDITLGGVDVEPPVSPGCRAGMHQPYEDN